MLTYRATAADFGAWLDRNVNKVGYLINTRGELCTQAMINARLADNAYAEYWINIRKYASQWLGKVVADCLGGYEMFLSGGEWDRPLSSWKYPNVKTGTVFSLALSEGLPNGPIGTLPRDCPYPIAVCYSGHVGYFYRGMVYQLSGHAFGLEITELANTAHNHVWEFWYYLPWLDYGEVEIMIQSGDGPSQAVYDLQTIYQKLGEDIGLFKNMLDPTVLDGRDGKYGNTCIGITKKLRAKYGLPVADYVDAALYGRLGVALMAIPSGITQTELDAEKARTAAAVAETAKVNQKLTDINNLLIMEQGNSQNWAADSSAKKVELQDVADAYRILAGIAGKY